MAKADEVRAGELRCVTAGRRDIVLCRTSDGGLHAMFGVCPHRGGPLGYGRVCPLVVSQTFGDYDLSSDTTVLRCPWHAFEFDVTTGVAVADPKFRVQTYDVKEADGEILVDV